MNSSIKARGLNGFSHARKRSSISNKAKSRVTQNVAQRCASLLRNNKSLAETLQETRCELSTYKNFFEDSLEYMSKAKLAKSKMVQLSTILKNFMNSFDEALLLMDFDDSKWPNIKVSKSSKNIPKGMNTVFEATDEIEQAVSTNQEMYCDKESNFEDSDQIFQNTSSPPRALQNSVNDEGSNGISKVSNKPLQKKTEDLPQKISSQTEETKDFSTGNDGTRKEIHNFSPMKCPDSNSLQNFTQAVKKTKIPRCQGFTGNLKKQNFLKESESKNSKPCKQKSPEQMCKKSDFDLSKRKTFVIKSNDILTNFESTKNQTAEEEIPNVSEDVLISKKDKRKTYIKKITDIPNEYEKTKNAQEDLLVSEKDKRKTFVKKTTDISKESEETTSNLFGLEKGKRKTCVIKNSNVLKEIEPFVCLNKIEDKEIMLGNGVILSEASDIDDVFCSKSNRKTFVKKNSDKMVSPQNNIPEYEYSSPVKGCTPVKSKFSSLVAVEQDKNNSAENLEESSEFQCNMNNLQTDLVAKSIDAEMIEPTVRVIKFNNSNKEVLSNKEARISTAIHSNDDDDKIKETSEDLNLKTVSVVPDHIVTDIPMHNIDELNVGITVSDASPKDEASVSPIKYSLKRSRRSYFESSESESDSDVLFVKEIDFSEKRPAFQKTPIRRQISKNKKRKFNFDVNKRKSILKKNSINESDVDAGNVNKNNVNAGNDKSVHFISDHVVIIDKISSLQSDACGSTKKKNAETSRKKMKENRETSVKNNTKKAASKLHKVKVNKRNSSKDAEVDDLIPKPKKTKKKNIKRRINEDDDVISKFREVNKIIPQVDLKIVKTEKDVETDFPCKKTGKNTYLVHAEIHAPPPFSDVPEIKKLDEEIAKLKLKNMEVAVVLDDVLKSKDIKLLNVYDRDLLCAKNASMSFSGNTSNMFIDPNESIEKLRCDPVPDTDDLCLHSDAVLNASNFDVQSDPENDSENTRARRRKDVNYKEPSLNRKMRRC